MTENAPKPSLGYRALAGIGRLALKTVRLVARGIDAVFHFVADRAMDRHLDKQYRLAMQVPEYAAIEQRRRREGSDYIIWASEKDDLGLEQIDIQSKIRHDVKPEPAWFPVARFFRNRPLTSAIAHLRMAYQRVNRGWDDRSLWSLDDHLCKTLGAQLVELADIAHGWPSGDKYPEYEDWTAALRKNGAALTAYSTRWELWADESLDRDTINKKETKIIADAKRSLRWVAENLGSLWD
jgi:hypothetical protein